MDSEKTAGAESAKNTEARGEESEVDRSFQLIQDTLGAMHYAADVRRVYAEPVEHGETLVIPAAEIVTLVGMGSGAGTGSRVDPESGRRVEGGSGGGGGGGGKSFARPVAVVVASPQGVRVEPVIDLTKIGLAALTAAGFMLAAYMRMVSPKRALKELKGE